MDYTQIHKDFKSKIDIISESFEDSLDLEYFSVSYKTILEHWKYKDKSPFEISKEERIADNIELANIHFSIKKPRPDKGPTSLYVWEPKIEAKLEILAFEQNLYLKTKSLLRKIESEGYKCWVELKYWESEGSFHGHIRIH